MLPCTGCALAYCTLIWGQAHLGRTHAQLELKRAELHVPAVPPQATPRCCCRAHAAPRPPTPPPSQELGAQVVSHQPSILQTAVPEVRRRGGSGDAGRGCLGASLGSLLRPHPASGPRFSIASWRRLRCMGRSRALHSGPPTRLQAADRRLLRFMKDFTWQYSSLCTVRGETPPVLVHAMSNAGARRPAACRARPRCGRAPCDCCSVLGVAVGMACMPVACMCGAPRLFASHALDWVLFSHALLPGFIAFGTMLHLTSLLQHSRVQPLSPASGGNTMPPQLEFNPSMWRRGGGGGGMTARSYGLWGATEGQQPGGWRLGEEPGVHPFVRDPPSLAVLSAFRQVGLWQGAIALVMGSPASR